MARRIRTFIAIALDRTVHERTVALQGELAEAGADVKWVEEANLHLTLLFLGEVAERELHEVCAAAAVGVSGHAPFEMSVAKVGAFPNLRRPRTLWVGIEEGQEEVVALHDALELPLLEQGCYRREGRPYTPHITLGRARTDHIGDQLPALLAKHANWQGGHTQVREVRVMSSELTPDGPIYTVMSRAKLSAGQ